MSGEATIRAALEAAHTAMADAILRAADEDLCGEVAVKATATAIAAFLRRAADVHAGCYVSMELRELLKHLAAAVLAASEPHHE